MPRASLPSTEPKHRRSVPLRSCVLALVIGALSSCEHRQTDRRTRVEFWTLALSPFFDEYIQERIATFERENPSIDVVWVDVPYDALDRKLVASAAAGRAPDVVNVADLNFARYVALGAFQDLSQLTPGDPREQYLQSALALCTISGNDASKVDPPGARATPVMRTMGLPWYVAPQVSIINVELLARGGLTMTDLDGTWRGLMQRAREFHNKTGAFLFSQPLGEESQLPIMMLADGFVPLREREGELRASLQTPEIIAFLREWVDLYRSGALPRAAATTGHSHLTEMFQRGQLATIVTGPNFLKRIRDAAPSMYQRVKVMPGMTGTLGRNHMPVMVLGVMNTSRSPREAASLAWFMTGPESQTAFCKIVPIMPSSKASLEDPFFAPSGGGELIERARALTAASLPNAVAFTAALEAWPDMRRAFQEQMKRVLTDGADLEEAMSRVEKEWDELLAASSPATLDAVPRPAPLDR
ncbi:MAG: extracellular solute-binding protein [Planctomycetota bacterium]|nr:extracellular solute-binding protein [Planctomycetota bacterium]